MISTSVLRSSYERRMVLRDICCYDEIHFLIVLVLSLITFFDTRYKSGNNNNRPLVQNRVGVSDYVRILYLLERVSTSLFLFRIHASVLQPLQDLPTSR